MLCGWCLKICSCARGESGEILRSDLLLETACKCFVVMLTLAVAMPFAMTNCKIRLSLRKFSAIFSGTKVCTSEFWTRIFGLNFFNCFFPALEKLTSRNSPSEKPRNRAENPHCTFAGPFDYLSYDSKKKLVIAVAVPWCTHFWYWTNWRSNLEICRQFG